MVRRAKKEDINILIKLLEEVNIIHANARPDIFNVATKYTDLELEEKLKNEPILVYEDETSKEVLGYIFGLIQDKSNHIIKPNKTFFIDDFCVASNARGKHVGTKLYEACKEYARSLGCKRITLNVWSFNENAYKFYLKCGLKPLEMVMEEIL